MKRRSFLSGLAALPLLPSLAHAIDPRDETWGAAGSSNAFGLTLLKDGGKNALIAPAGITGTLAAALLGVGGRTEADLVRALRRSGGARSAAVAYARLARILDGGDERCRLSLASQLFGQKGTWWKRPFTDTLRRELTPPAEVDFARNSNGARAAINDWMLNHTQKRVPTIVGPNDVDATTDLVLAGVTDFEAVWKNNFAFQDNRYLPFTPAGGKPTTVRMMEKGMTLDVGTIDGVRVARIPYGGDGRMEMTVFLPPEGQSLDRFVGSFDSENLLYWRHRLKPKEVVLRLPQFTATASLDLKSILEKRGVRLDRGADFSRMTDRRVGLGRIAHESVLRVAEAGTHSAHVTLVTVLPSSARPPAPTGTPFYLDRPFFYAVSERDTGAAIFLGRMDEPPAP